MQQSEPVIEFRDVAFHLDGGTALVSGLSFEVRAGAERQLLWQVQVPLSLGVILAGIRVAAVISVGVATIAAAIGAGGLGTYIFRGVAMVNNQVILAGAIPAAILALLADAGLGWAERRLAAR